MVFSILEIDSDTVIRDIHVTIGAIVLTLILLLVIVKVLRACAKHSKANKQVERRMRHR